MTYWHGVQVAFADPVNACVLWRIELDLVRGCNHVNLVTATHVEVWTRLLWPCMRSLVRVRTRKVHWEGSQCCVLHRCVVRRCALHDL